jgi:hypothetical protein
VRRGEGLPEDVGRVAWEVNYLRLIDWLCQELVRRGEGLPEDVGRVAWEVNYREAAIFLEEGENNDKFLHHPRDIEALPAYLLVSLPNLYKRLYSFLFLSGFFHIIFKIL